MTEKNYWEVKFKFKYPKDLAEDIRLVGNTESLGMWNVDKAVKLIYEPKKEIWETKSYIKIPASIELKYKYLLFKNDFFVKEENSDISRQVSIPEQEKLILSSEKDMPETSIQKHSLKTKRKSSKEINGNKNKTSLKPLLKNVNSNKKNNNKSKEEKNITIQFNLEENNNIKNNKEKEEDNSSNEDNDKKFNDLFDNFYDSLDYFSDNKDDSAKDWTMPKLEELNKDDDIIMCSTYVPFNPVRGKDGKINFVLTNESIYHTLYRVIQSNKNIKWFGNLKYLKKLNEKDRKEIIERLEKKKYFCFRYR